MVPDKTQSDQTHSLSNMAEKPTNGTSYTRLPAVAVMPPMEIISSESDEAAIDKASLPSVTEFPRNIRTINSITSLSKRKLFSCSLSESVGDIEELASPEAYHQRKRMSTNSGSFLNRFRGDTGLWITDLTGAEWCEKKMEFKLLNPFTLKTNYAMKADSGRYAAAFEDEPVSSIVGVSNGNFHRAGKLGLCQNMDESPNHSPPTSHPSSRTPQIPIEIISDEEMAFIEVAMAAATRSIIPPLTQFSRNTVRSVNSITLLSKRRLSSCNTRDSESLGDDDIEDSASSKCCQKKRNRTRESFLDRFRRNRGLAVTDVTGTEWCEKQTEYKLVDGKPKASKAMKAGRARHAELEDEVSKKVIVHVTSSEDVWALKFLNFILSLNQLLFDGLTRELPIVSFEEGVWMVGVIDEIQMSGIDTERHAVLLDIKTRKQAKLPLEPQRRNGRLQLMCYKSMWDNLGADKFPVEKFYMSFSLNRYRAFSAQIRDYAAESGIPAENLNDLVAHFQNACRLLPPAHDQLLLRYELQEDQSLLGEDQFAYNEDWLASKLKSCLEFWRGEREPDYPPIEERWKCNSCKFSSKCRSNAIV